jgi:hypothetical protein
MYYPESGADLHFDNVDNDVGLGWFDGILAADLVKEIWQRALKAEKYVHQCWADLTASSLQISSRRSDSGP